MWAVICNKMWSVIIWNETSHLGIFFVFWLNYMKFIITIWWMFINKNCPYLVDAIDNVYFYFYFFYMWLWVLCKNQFSVFMLIKLKLLFMLVIFGVYILCSSLLITKNKCRYQYKDGSVVTLASYCSTEIPVYILIFIHHFW